MTPQEQELVEELFDRLAKLENSPRDPAAERVIADVLRRAPQATYALVQTALVQDEAPQAVALIEPVRDDQTETKNDASAHCNERLRIRQLPAQQKTGTLH